MKNQKRLFKTLTILVVTLIGFPSYGQTDNDDLKDDNVEQVIKITGLIDGGVKNLESANKNDVTSTGLVGFRYDTERSNFRIAISAVSSFDSISSNKTSDFSKNILNTGISKAGLSSILFDFHLRFLSCKGFPYYLARKKYLSKSQTIDRTDEYLKFLLRNSLDNLSWYQKYIGFRTYGEISNSKWNSDSLKGLKNVSIASFGIGLTYYKQFINTQSFDVSFYGGAGLTSRLIFNDISQSKYKEARENILSTSDLFFWGPEIFVGINVNNVYTKFNLPIFIKDKSIDGLTNGQPVLSIGLTADIGSVVKVPKKIVNVCNSNVKALTK